MTDVKPARFYVDQGYRGHDYAKTDRVFTSRDSGGVWRPQSSGN
jgi:IS5 family transposase